MRHSKLLSIALAVAACAPAESGDEAANGATVGGKADDAKGTEPVTGVADLHLHMFGEHAFGGAWLHGTHAGEASSALAPCDGGHDHAILRDDLTGILTPGTCEGMSLFELAWRVPLAGGMLLAGGGIVSEQIGKIRGTDGDTGRHEDRTQGYPGFEGWPRWDTIAHQQAWEGQLEDAWRAGLRLEVISAVSMGWLCNALPEENRARPQCSEFDDVMVQLEAARAFADRVDWAEIATSPDEARRIINEGKLALVLSVEADRIMDEFDDWRVPFEAFYDAGVRTLQPVHSLDNRFSGTALHNVIFQLAQYTDNCHVDTDCGATTDDITLGFDVDESCKNVVGLRPDGVELVAEMMDRGMLVDVAHFSERAMEDIFAMSKERDYYPFYISHGHFRDIMRGKKGYEEKASPAWVVDMVRQTGGMFGLRTGPEATHTFKGGAVENTCAGSSRSFAQAYEFGREALDVDIGLGADFNGFIQQARPRFGADACSDTFRGERVCQAEAQEKDASAPRLGTDFDELGLAHTGLLIDLVRDIEQMGADTSQLYSSAELYIQMWERAAADREGPAALPLDLDAVEAQIQIEEDPRRLDRYDCEL
ncbi:MAG: membrane dipeptidase [Myxococcota bacterium]